MPGTESGTVIGTGETSVNEKDKAFVLKGTVF